MPIHFSRLFARYGTALIGAVLVCFIVPTAARAASLRELQDQLKKAEQDLARYQDLRQKEQSKAQTYSEDIKKTEQQISSVKSSIASLETNISEKENSITQTNQEIEEKLNQLNQLVNERNEALATFYELTNLSNLEMLADAHTLSHFVDQTEYIHALEDRIVGSIEKVSTIKQELETTRSKLETQKNELAALKGEQEAKNVKLTSAQQQNYSLLNRAKANEAQYQSMLKKLEQDKHKIANEIYELRRRMSRKNNEIYAGGTSGYPYAAIHAVDPWGFLTRECTSYAAWKWNVVYGRSFENTRPGQGSAWNWPNLARDQGYSVVSTPRKSAIISWPSGAITSQWGHVAIVENINPDGTIDISEYNYLKYAYSYRKNVRYWDYGNASFIIP